MTGLVTETELQAFVDDQLDPEGRIEVLDHLLRDPACCRRTLLDLRGREAMRALCARSRAAPSAAMIDAARKVEERAARPPARRWRLQALGAAALAIGPVALAILSWPAAEVAAATPPYLKEAIEARRVASLRQGMASQVETPAFDSRDIHDATRIQVPELPDGWHIADVQVFPSDFGPALQLSIRTADGGALSLFATHAQTGAPGEPRRVRVNGIELVSWAKGGNTYVLTGTQLEGRLLDLAHDLADNQFA